MNLRTNRFGSREVLLNKEERLDRKQSAIVKVYCDIAAECFIAVYV